MPNIAQYTSTNGVPFQPSDAAANTAREAAGTFIRMGNELGQAVGGATREIGNQVGQAVENYQTAQAIGHGAAAYSKMFADLSQQWNQRAANADPNDSSIQKDFTENTLEPALQKFQAAFDGEPQRAQDWALSQTDSARQHFFTTTSADMGTRAAMAAHQNLQAIELNFSNAAHDDPTTLDHAAQTIGSSIDSIIASSPFMTADAAARLKAEEMPRMLRSVAMSAGLGIGTRNPDQLVSDITQGKFDQYLNAEDKNSLVEAANRFKNQQYDAIEHQRTLANQKAEDSAKQAYDEYVTNLNLHKGLDPKAMNLDPRLSGFPQIKTAITEYQHRLTEYAKAGATEPPHPQAVRQVMTDMFNTARDNPYALNVQTIRDAMTKGVNVNGQIVKLNPNEEIELESRFNALDKPMELNFHSQMMHVEKAISSSPGLSAFPDRAAATVNLIETDAHAKLDAWRQQGKDVTPLLDPKSPEYLFSPEKVRSYMGTPQQAVSNQADKVRSGATMQPPKAALDYLKAHPESAGDFKKKFGFLPGGEA